MEKIILSPVIKILDTSLCFSYFDCLWKTFLKWNESFSLGEFVTLKEVCFSFNVKKLLESKFIFSGDDIGWFALVYL